MIDINKYDAFVFDLDGVVWLHNTPIPGAAATISSLRKSGKQLRFMTNNASQHRSFYLQKLANAGIDTELPEIVSSGYATAKYIAKEYGSSNVHVMGMDGLRQEMEDAGHRLVERNAEIVAGGFDRTFSWEKLNLAFANIEQDGARFIACNDDRKYPTPEGNQPGTGANIAALSFATGKDPEIVVGKPNQPILDCLFSNLDIPASSCLMVGDKVFQDIGVGQRAGMATAFVLSGVDDETAIQRHDIKPTYILDSIADIVS